MTRWLHYFVPWLGLTAALLACSDLSTGWPNPAKSAGGGPSTLAQPLAPRPNDAPTTPLPQRPVELGRLTVTLAGDVIPHQAVSRAAADHPESGQEGWDWLLEPTGDLLKRGDFAIVNLESPVLAPERKANTGPYRFNAPPALVGALRQAGVEAVWVANNHQLDQGAQGLDETLAQLEAAGVRAVGAGRGPSAAYEPVAFERNGIRLCLLGMTRWLNGNANPTGPTQPNLANAPYPNPNASEGETRMLATVVAARGVCDAVMVGIHWGLEYATAPTPADVDLAHRLVDAGADAVIGHHPHVLQSAETYLTGDGRYGVIFYSLGNYISNQSRKYVHGVTPESVGEPRDSLIATITLARRDYGGGLIRVELGNVGYWPLWTHNNNLRLGRGADKLTEIRPVALDREIDRLRASPLPDAPPQARIEAMRELEMLLRRRELILERVGDQFALPTPALPQ